MPRVNVTILVTDIVDSTRRAHEMGDRAWARLIARHDAVLRSTVAAHGGVTVKTLGDGLLATFAVPAQAVRAAAAARVAAAGLDLTVRAGLHTGEVDRANDDVVGLAVHLASRVVSHAGAGEVLVTEVVRDLLADSTLRFDDRGECTLKGFESPSHIFVFTGDESLGRDLSLERITLAVPVPSELAKRRKLPCVGRDAALRRLRAALDGAVAGSTGVVLVSGEPGIGKTRLCSEIAAAAVNTGVLVLYGRCDDGIDVAYQPFVEALEHFVASVSPNALRSLLGPHAGELVRLLPDLPELVPILTEPSRIEPESERYRLFQAVAAWLSATSRAAPILLIVDDLHWADESTLRLLEHLAGRLDGARVCLVLTCRDYEAATMPSLRRSIASLSRQHDQIGRIELEGLSADETTDLVAATYGHGSETTTLMADAIYAESGGNPLVIGEVLRHLLERANADGNVIAGYVDPAMDLHSVLTTVSEHIARRISALPAPVRSMLEVAALVGREYPVNVLREVIGDEDVVSLLETAEGARLIVEVNESGPLRYRFSHALIRAALVGGQNTVRRAVTHARIAQAYERLHAGRLDRVSGELAKHWAEAAPVGYSEQALDASALAAAAALRAQAYEPAEQQYEFALELYDTYGGSDAMRDELVAGLAQARARVDITAASETDAGASRDPRCSPELVSTTDG